MPLYDASAFVGEALQSIQAQTIPVWQVIVVDDGSTDGSADVATQFPFVTLIRGPHRGISATLNHALDFANGEYLAFLDNDDRWLPRKTELQLRALQGNPSLDLAFGQARRFRATQDGEETLDSVPGVTKSCLLIRRSSFARVGNFPEDESHDFLHWYARALEASLSVAILPEVVTERRIHPHNYGVLQRDRQRRTYLTALKAGLDRRRRTLQTAHPQNGLPL